MDLARLFVEDPDLLRGVSCNRARLERRVVVETRTIQPGEWHPSPELEDDRLLGLLVLDGVLVHEEEVMGVRGGELLGQGDLLRLGECEGWGSLSLESSWTILEPTRVAVLDDEFQLAIASAPEVTLELMRRIFARSHETLVRLALSRKRALPTRTHAWLWQLADRFGHRRQGAVEIPLRLSHRVAADLIGCERAAFTRA